MYNFMAAKKTKIIIPFDVLPEAKQWKVSKKYKVNLVLQQTGMDEDGATFAILDAKSLEPTDEQRRKFLHSDSGIIKAN